MRTSAIRIEFVGCPRPVTVGNGGDNSDRVVSIGISRASDGRSRGASRKIVTVYFVEMGIGDDGCMFGAPLPSNDGFGSTLN